MELKSQVEAQYGLRHLRPSNLSEMRKELRVQLAHLKKAVFRPFIVNDKNAPRN